MWGCDLRGCAIRPARLPDQPRRGSIVKPRTEVLGILVWEGASPGRDGHTTLSEIFAFA